MGRGGAEKALNFPLTEKIIIDKIRTPEFIGKVEVP